LYTSPHLKDFRERIRINGDLIPEKEVVAFIEENQAFLSLNRLSFFEMTVGMAFYYFAKQKVDIAIIETGMGGRLDSTNIINPELSVITNIGLDHTAFLGNELAEIAAEKAGIIKQQTSVVIGEKQTETSPVFIEKAQEKNSDLHFAEDHEFPSYDTDLKGDYQNKNLRTVLTALKVLKEQAWQISEEALIYGLNNVKLQTGLQGRWEILGEKPKVICDTAHNAEGLKLVMQQLKKEEFQQLHMLIGVVNDKDLSTVFPLLPKDAIFYFAKPDVPRGLDAEILRVEAAKAGLSGVAYGSVHDAFLAAKQAASEDDLIFVGGSNFTVAEVL
jgi:dihydrofolate synthase / folylpolyglutamate synthase